MARVKLNAEAERRRDDAIAAVGGALLTVSRVDYRPSIDECGDMARRIVDACTTHAVDVVRALIAAEEATKRDG
jgi:hypothetical protein